MKIFIYLIILILIYFYILKKNIYIITRNQHIYFWVTIFIILFICYLMKYHKYHLYKFLENITLVHQKPYFSNQ